MHTDSITQKCDEAASFLWQLMPDFRPELGIVLGSGLGNFGSRIRVDQAIPYEDIPHFKPSRVAGHAGRLLLGSVAGKKVICQQGRFHYYEGHTPQEVVFPVRTMAHMGAKTLIVTNAAGGINPGFEPGTIMLIRDHINMTGTNPLIGPDEPELGPRFPDMSFAYDPELARLMHRSAQDLSMALREGTYLGLAGPSYETPAEIRMFRNWGADAVGMSTVHEVIAANQRGMRVLGLSCISNLAAGMTDAPLSHDEVKEVTTRMGDQFETLVLKWIENL